jgi:hypothetical protein
LPLDDLRHLLQHCQKPEHLNYITHGLRMWQKKGQDFSEDVASHFVRACLRAENPKIAAEICAKYKYRIGAWLTPKPMTPLVEELVKKNEIEVLISMFITISLKGVIATKESFSLLFDAMSADKKYEEHHAAMMTAASRMLSAEDYAIIAEKYSPPKNN